MNYLRFLIWYGYTFTSSVLNHRVLSTNIKLIRCADLTSPYNLMNGVPQPSMLKVLSFNHFIKGLSFLKTDIDIANHADSKTSYKPIYL